MAQIDNDIFAGLVRGNMGNMYRLALSILGNVSDAEDAVSSAVIKAYEKREQLKKESSFKPWIMTITANEAKKICFGRRRETSLEELGDVFAGKEEEYHELWDVVSGLDKIYREVIVLFYYEQFTVKEIGKALHIPTGTVKSRLSRAREELRRCFHEGSF